MEKVTFLISNRCNLRCKHCFVNAGNEIKNELNEEQKYKAIDKLYDFGVKKITFSGGEPLLDKNLFDYMNYAKDKGLRIGFLTNGLLLDEDKINKLKQMVDTFSISLYTQDILGVNDKFYKVYFEKTIKNLKILSEKAFDFKITIPISTVNKEEAIKFIELLYEERIRPKTVRIYMITPLGRANKNQNLCTEELNCSSIFEELPEYIKKSDLNIGTEYSSIKKHKIDDSRFYTYCPVIKYESSYINKYGDPHMDSNGDLYLCGLLIREKKYCIGNILTNSKEEIMNNIKEVASLIKKQIKNDCCPVLNRKARENEVLVCPVIYLKNESKMRKEEDK